LGVKLAGMLSLKPEDGKRLHHEALKRFNAQGAEIQFEVSPGELIIQLYLALN